MHIQLDAIGGVAGDMFAAAMLDAFPKLEDAVIAAVAALTAVECRVVAHNDGTLQGRRFLVSPLRDAPTLRDPPHRHNGDGHGHGHDARAAGHGHRPWVSIRADLRHAPLDPRVRDCAIEIFEGLARAEAAVHGIDVEAVAFHEVGAWDSIADIVAAAALVKGCGATSWSVGPLPLGSGRVATAHGPMPVPAPATTLLLRGLPTIDDGIGGERVTPTGAAILRYLVDASPSARTQQPRCISGSGIGFGSRILPGLSNCLRVLSFSESEARPDGSHRELAVVEFEVDDQSAEDLAMGLDRLRAHRDIFDVVQMPVFGKKGRMMTHVRALARAGADDAIAACFRETTTIGLRHRVVDGVALPRAARDVTVSGRLVRVKTVERPGGERTAKAEADDAMGHETHAARARLRREAERRALEQDDTTIVTRDV